MINKKNMAKLEGSLKEFNEFETLEGDSLYDENELTKFEEDDLNKLQKIIKTVDISAVKNEVVEKFGLQKSQIAFSKISESNNLWNFDIKKDFAFVFYNQEMSKYKISYIKARTLDVVLFPDKDVSTIRFFIDKQYIDRSGFKFNLLG